MSTEVCRVLIAAVVCVRQVPRWPTRQQQPHLTRLSNDMSESFLGRVAAPGVTREDATNTQLLQRHKWIVGTYLVSLYRLF